MLKFIKALFTKKEAQPKEEAARGVIEKFENETTTITITHKGGDRFEIMEMSKITGKGFGCLRRGETRAKQHFAFYRSLCA